MKPEEQHTILSGEMYKTKRHQAEYGKGVKFDVLEHLKINDNLIRILKWQMKHH